jgi:MoaA/NifB/PqqE/SkfB family radical SAM enzyme
MPKNPFRVVLQNPGFLGTLWRKPRLAGAVLRQRWLQWNRSKKGLNTLAGIEFALTYSCQATCAHCSASSLHDVDQEKGRLDLDELRAHAQSAFDLGVYEVNLTGGEPTLLKNLEEIVGCFRPERTFIGVNTNAMLLDVPRVKSLRDAGVDLLKISLDSPDAEAHDSNRGLPGNHAHVLELLEELKRIRGIRGHICSVGTAELVRNGGAAELVDMAASRGATIGFTLPAAVGRWGGDYHVMLEPEDLENLRDVCRQPNAFFQGSVGLSTFQCPAAREEVYVSPYGDVLPCPFVQRSFGNLRDEGFDVVYDRMGQAAEMAGDASMCLAGEAIRWMKQNVPASRERVDMPTCSTEHADSFCRSPTDAATAGDPISIGRP